MVEGNKEEAFIHHLPKIHLLKLELPALPSCVSEPRGSFHNVCDPHTTPPTPTVASADKSQDERWVADSPAWDEVQSGCVQVKLMRSCTELVLRQWLTGKKNRMVLKESGTVTKSTSPLIFSESCVINIIRVPNHKAEKGNNGLIFYTVPVFKYTLQIIPLVIILCHPFMCMCVCICINNVFPFPRWPWCFSHVWDTR